MLRLCLIHSETLFQYALAEGASEVLYTPLARWKPARITAGVMTLPEGWRTAEDYPTDRISLHEEGNYLLKDDRNTALLMVRLTEEDGLCSVTAAMTGRFTVGRSRSNDICCRDGYLSSFHGVFSFNRDGRLCYEDTSTNGVFVNGEHLCGGMRLLRDGDQIDFPPLMQATVDGTAMRIRYPKAHGQLQLEALQPAPQGEVNMAVYLPQTGKLRQILLPAGICGGSELRSSVLACLAPEDAAVLPPEPVLRIAGETALIGPADHVQLRAGLVLVAG